ncbi:autophagy-related protein 27 [Sphaerosporella brunnea]|uniref:Autophagy-related protein 27 n=1 Tax=Sphaerosporella brunnea TaxID=1250544 RepID=A0A5J5EUF3_9PEZI|nr:autophagy-related protein 27 [Sphaerosporella brunnea]
MRPPVATLLLLAGASFSHASSWGCEHVENGLKYDFKELAGKHELSHVEDKFFRKQNTTWQINPCGPLQKTKEDHPKDQCPAGTYVCGLVRYINDKGESNLEEIIPVAGDVDTSHKLDMEVHKFDEDGQTGLQVIYNGGKYGPHEQRAVVKFVCDMGRTGLEGTPVVDGKDGRKERRDEQKDKDEKDPSLKFISYEYHEGVGKEELRLEWRTRLACEEYVRNKGSKESDPSSHWGFFTWVFILVFLSVAAYLIFGSWLNYNRYGARGWDLLPHGDTIRDLPYLVKDFMKRVGSTLQGRSSRGGYSAV